MGNELAVSPALGQPLGHDALQYSKNLEHGPLIVIDLGLSKTFYNEATRLIHFTINDQLSLKKGHKSLRTEAAWEVASRATLVLCEVIGTQNFLQDFRLISL